MLGEDLAGRFDYLFEPLEVDEWAGESDDVAPRALEQPDDDSRWSRRLVLTGVVLATTAVGVATAMVLLQPAQLAQLIVTPSDATPPTTTAQPVPVVPATVSTSAVQTSAVTPTGVPQRP